MTIAEALTQLDALKPNTATVAQKCQWLSQVEQEVIRQIFQDDRAFSDYTEATDPATVLLLPAPHDRIYLYFLGAQIDFWNREYEGYNAQIALYNRQIGQFRAQWLRCNAPAHGGFTGWGVG